MMKSVSAIILLCLMTALSLTSAHTAHAGEMQLITKGADVTLVEEKAYILVRNTKVIKRFAGAPILIRRLNETEKADYESAKREAYDAKDRDVPYERFTPKYKKVENVYFFNPKKSYEREDDYRVWLAEVPPGTYVVYAQAYGASGGGCMCMGSVEFNAKAGVITDMGYFNTDLIDPRKTPSAFPWVNDISEGRDDYKAGMGVIAVKVMPHEDTMSIPEKLTPLKREPAAYNAVGKMPNYMSMMILRLEPMEGVLGYEEDTVVDLRTGQKFR